MVKRLRPGRCSAFLLAAVITFLLGNLTTAPSARAHPHAFIDAKIAVHFNEAKITRLSVTWWFDEDYSATLTDVFDADHDGKLSSAEASAFAVHMGKVLAGHHYFVDLLTGSKRWGIDRAEKMTAAIEADGRLRLTFDLVLPAPVDPHVFAVSVYDPTYYIEVGFVAKSPASFVGGLDPGCTAKVEEDSSNPIYFGAVLPQILRFVCSG